MDSLHRLEEIFAKFPGIGPRQARRFVYYLLNKPTSQISEFIKLIGEVRKMVSECSSCHRIYVYHGRNVGASEFQPSSGEISNARGFSSTFDTTPTPVGVPLCSICSDRTRDQKTLMIVARDSDFETIEKSGAFKGLYFILGGTVPILDKEPDKRIRLETLLRRIADQSTEKTTSGKTVARKTASEQTVSESLESFESSESLKEIILSLNTTPEGEHTANIVSEALHKLIGEKPIKISVLGRGLSTGAELEYADSETIRNALKNRS